MISSVGIGSIARPSLYADTLVSIFRAGLWCLIGLLSLVLASSKVCADEKESAYTQAETITGKYIQARLTRRSEQLTIDLLPLAGKKSFSACSLQLELDNRAQAFTSPAPCRFAATVHTDGADRRHIRLRVSADGINENLQAEMAFPSRDSIKGDKSDRQWGTFAALLFFVIAVLLGALLALKRTA